MGEIETQLLQLQSAQLVRRTDDPDPAYLFKHVLVQETAYASLLRKKRRDTHLLVAQAYEELYPERAREDAALLAHHYWLAEEWARAAECSMRAGEHAFQVYSLREAIAHFERAEVALEKIPDAAPQRILDAILGWAQAAFKFRPYAEQLDHLKQAEKIARELNDKLRLARVLYAIGKVHRASGYNLRAAPPLVEVFALAEELDDESLTIIPTYYMANVMMDSNPRGALPLFERAIELARKYRDADTEAFALSTRALVRARLGEFALAQQDLQAAMQVLAQVNSPMTESDVDLFAAWSYLDMGDVTRGLEYGQRGVAKALATDNMDCVCYGFACLGFGNMQAQKLPEAIAAFEESVRRSQISGAVQVENLARSGLAMAHFFGGRREALSEIEHALASARALDNQLVSALLAQSLGEIYAQLGDVGRASTHLNAALDFYRQRDMQPYLTRVLQSLNRLNEHQGREMKTEKVSPDAGSLLPL